MIQQPNNTGLIDADNSELQMQPESISVNIQSASESYTNSSHSYMQQPVNFNSSLSFQITGDSSNSINPTPDHFVSLSNIENNNSRGESFANEEGNSLDNTAMRNILPINELVENEPNRNNNTITEIRENYRHGLVGIFIGARGYDKKFIYAQKKLKFNTIIEEYKTQVNGPNISNTNFIYKNEYIDPNKTIEELKIKPLSQIYDYKK